MWCQLCVLKTENKQRTEAPTMAPWLLEKIWDRKELHKQQHTTTHNHTTLHHTAIDMAKCFVKFRFSRVIINDSTLMQRGYLYSCLQGVTVYNALPEYLLTLRLKHIKIILQIEKSYINLAALWFITKVTNTRKPTSHNLVNAKMRYQSYKREIVFYHLLFYCMQQIFLAGLFCMNKKNSHPSGSGIFFF